MQRQHAKVQRLHGIMFWALLQRKSKSEPAAQASGLLAGAAGSSLQESTERALQLTVCRFILYDYERRARDSYTNGLTFEHERDL